MNDNLPSVRLRAMEPEDLDILYRIENDTKLWNVGVTNVPYSRFTLHNYIADTQNDIYTDRQLRMMIENETGEVVGIVDLINFEPRHRRAEVGVVVINRYRRKGYASSAIKQLATYARDILHLHQLYALVDQSNSECIQLLRSLDFSNTTTFTDWLFKDGSYHDALLMQLFME